jgi:hypothetical protein
MSKPTEYKTVQARILAYAEAEGRDIGNWRLDIGERREDSNSESLSSLRSLRLFNSGFRGLNRRERRDRKEDLDRAISQQAVAKSSGWKFSRRLRENRLLASEHFCNRRFQIVSE